MRWLGIDYGSKRIGLAVGDTHTGLASPVEVLPAGDEAVIFRKISSICEEYSCDALLVGLPLNMDDTLGPQGKKTAEFALRLAEETHLEVRMWDERLSSFDADSLLAGQMTRKKRKKRQDAIAAASFLGDFLSRHNDSDAPTPNQVLEDA